MKIQNRSASLFLGALGGTLGVLSGCATTGGGGSGGGGGGPGRLDPALVEVAASAQGVRKIELHAEPGGGLRKMSVYHLDTSRIPEPVRKLAEQKFPGGKLRSFESERYADAGLVYEVEVDTSDGKVCEVSASGEGALRYTECRLRPEELPPEVARTVSATVPGASIEEAELLTGPAIAGEREFRIEARAGGVTHYLRLRPSGELFRHGLLVPAQIEVPVR
jgi:hypothetical protein